MRQRERSAWLATLAAGALATGMAGCGAHGRPETVGQAAASGTLPTVAVAKASRADLAREWELTAEFRPYLEVDVHAKVAGYLRQVTVDVGDRVQKGQLLGVLEVPELSQELLRASAVEKRTELDVARAEAEVRRAETALRIHEISYDRLAAVAKTRPNLIARQEIDNAEAKLREAEAQVVTAKAALAATREQVQVSGASKAQVGTMLDYLRITAPFSGMVTKRYADPGAMIQAGTASRSQSMPLVRVSQTDRLRLVLPVPESMVPRIRVGTPVEVRVDSLSRVFQGRVTRFAGRLDTMTRTMETEVEMPNPDGTLLPGMYAYASLQLERRQAALTLPVQAAGGAAGQAGAPRTIFVVGQDGVVSSRQVRFGLETPQRVEVLSGLREGDLVVMGGGTPVRAGQRVRPRLVALATESAR